MTEENEELEEKGFQAAVDSLVPETEKHPLEDEVPGETETEGEAAGEEEEILPEKFLGDFTKEEVLAKLQLLDELQSNTQKIFGKFGEVNQTLKDLQGKEFKFDPSKLVKLKELDEGLANALQEDLAGAFSGQQFDPNGAVDALKQAVLADVNPYVEQRLLRSIVPDAETITQTEEFSNWFWNQADDSIRNAFKAWDEKTEMDGLAIARAFMEFEQFQETATAAANAKADSLRKSAEDRRAGGGAPQGRKTMTEEEAFNTRLKEVKNR